MWIVAHANLHQISAEMGMFLFPAREVHQCLGRPDRPECSRDAKDRCAGAGVHFAEKTKENRKKVRSNYY